MDPTTIYGWMRVTMTAVTSLNNDRELEWKAFNLSHIFFYYYFRCTSASCLSLSAKKRPSRKTRISFNDCNDRESLAEKRGSG